MGKFYNIKRDPFLLKINIFFIEGGLQVAPLKNSIFLEGIYFGGPWNHFKSEKFWKKLLDPFNYIKQYTFLGEIIIHRTETIQLFTLTMSNQHISLHKL